MIKAITINENDTIINNNSNFLIDDLINKSLENEKRNKNTNITIII